MSNTKLHCLQVSSRVHTCSRRAVHPSLSLDPTSRLQPVASARGCVLAWLPGPALQLHLSWALDRLEALLSPSSYDHIIKTSIGKDPPPARSPEPAVLAG